GQPRATIVIGADHSRTDEWCARELQTWLEEITGARLPIVTDDTPVDGNILAVSRNRYTQELYGQPYRFEEYVLKTLSPTCLAFAGWEGESAVNAKGEWLRDDERGPLYAVYHFLEDLGVRWFYPGDWGWYAPRRPTLTVPTYDVRKAPATVIRWGINLGTSPDQQWNEAVGDWAVRSRFNTWLWGAKEKGGYVLPAYGGHNFQYVVPPDWFFDAHPEWFPLINGRRVRDGQLCLSNPDVLKRFADEARRCFAEDSACRFFAVWPNDMPAGWCECEACRAMDGPDGNVADRLVKFANAVAESLRADYPDRVIYTSAYTPAYFDPPTTVKPAENVWVQICRYWPVGDSTSTYYNQMTDQARHYYRALKRWTELGNVFLYTYYGFYASDLYYPIVYQLFADWPVKVSWGVRGGYAQTSQHWATNAWVYYTYPRVMFDPTLDEDAFRQDYFSKCYGQGGEAMRAFFEAVESKFRRTPCLLEWETVEGILDDELLSRMEQHLSAAQAAAAQDDWRTRKRIAVVREGFDYAREYLRFSRLLHQARRGDRSVLQAALDAYAEAAALREALARQGLLGANEHNYSAEVAMLKLDLTQLPPGPFRYDDYLKDGGFAALHSREMTFAREYWGLQLPAGARGHITYELGSKVATWERLEVSFLMDRKSPAGAQVSVSTDGGQTWQDAQETMDGAVRTGTWDLTALVGGKAHLLLRFACQNDSDQTAYVLTNVSMRGALKED
ncbi:MAG: DUF4838 domain-containing protein, partial [Armatimonadetes bacterium]|nr:DUF4838 domain-containing protein [Armatimonadota bacterium]